MTDNSRFSQLHHNVHTLFGRECMFDLGVVSKALTDPSGRSLSPAGTKDQVCWNLSCPILFFLPDLTPIHNRFLAKPPEIVLSPA